MKFDVFLTRNVIEDDSVEEQFFKEIGAKTVRCKHLYNTQQEFYTKLVDPVSIEINSLDELVSLTERLGEIVVFKKSIEIYNGYRE